MHRKFLRFFSLSAILLVCASFLSAQGLEEEGLILHLDAESIEGVEDGAAIPQGWEAIFPLGTVATSDFPPTFLSNAESGYPAVRFNGSNQYLEVPVSTGDAASVFIVFSHQREVSRTNYRDILLTGTNGGTNLSISSSRSAEVAPDYPSFDVLTGDFVNARSWVNGHDTEFATGDILRDRFYIGSVVYSELPDADGLLIGTRGTGGFNAGQNDIREILIYDRALSDTERERVQAYLGRKYDIEVIRRPLDHPVESFPHVLGSQQFGPHYTFGEAGISVVDYARATLRQGNRVVKFRLSNRFSSEDGFTPMAGIDRLVELVRDQPEVKTILDMPLTDYIFWVSTFSIPNWQNQVDDNGMNSTAQTRIYNEVYDMVVYLLTEYSGTGKRFYLGNWEGDWMLSAGDEGYRQNPNTIPEGRIQGMIDWANIRQKAVDDAKAATVHHDVDVWFYLEMNKADWMREGLTCVANSVIPEMPKLDMISISAYSVHKDNGNHPPRSRIHSDLDQVQALLDAKPDASIPGSRLMIGEYGWIYNDSYTSIEEFTHDHRITARHFMSWQGGAPRFVLQWQFFNAATRDNSNISKEMNQIGPENDPRPMYFLHENFYRLMRRWVDDYYMRTGNLPDGRAYADQANHILGFVSLSKYNPVFSFDTYRSWRNYHFLDAGEAGNEEIFGPFADPYGSGLSNLLRYGLGMGKFAVEEDRLPKLVPGSIRFHYAFPFDPAKTDLRWQVQAGTDLVTWNETLFDSAHDGLVTEEGWREVTADNLFAPGDPTYYRLVFNLEE